MVRACQGSLRVLSGTREFARGLGHALIRSPQNHGIILPALVLPSPSPLLMVGRGPRELACVGSLPCRWRSVITSHVCPRRHRASLAIIIFFVIKIKILICLMHSHDSGAASIFTDRLSSTSDGCFTQSSHIKSY
jgi:hypothetical protein